MVLRELPVITIQNNWTAGQTAAALYGSAEGGAPLAVMPLDEAVVVRPGQQYRYAVEVTA